MQNSTIYPNLDLKQALSSNRLVGLWRFMGGFHWLYLGAIVSLAVATAAKTLSYFLLQYFVDDVLIQQQATTPFYLIAAGFVGLALMQGLFTFWSGRLAAHSAEGAILRLRNYLFDHIQRLHFSYHDNNKTGELVQRCSSDVDTIRRLFAVQVIEVGRIVLLFTLNLAALMSLNLKLGLLSMISMPVVVVISLFFFRKIHVAYEAHQEQEGHLSTALQENLSGVRVVKAFARQPFEIDKFEETNYEQLRRGQRLVRLHSSFWPVAETISGAQTVFIMFVGALMTLNGEITIGTYLAVIGLIIWIVWPMQNLGRLIVQTSMGMVSYNRVAEILSENREQMDDDAPAPAQPIQGAVEFRDVSFEYNRDAPVLHHISFSVEPGQTVALLGPTGSGKSSLVNLLPRFYDYQGSILLDGRELTDYPKHALRQQIGIVEQEPFLFSRSIRENIAYGVRRPVTDEEVIAAAQAAAIHDVIMTFPDGYNTVVGEKGVTLSGGQKQRVAIARTLLKDPHILIFDDAVSAVDTETEAHIHAALERLRQGRTTFMIAHRIQTVMRADKILVLEHGRIIQQGSHRELLAQDGIYRRIYDVQARVGNDE
ncbi:MAG: ABC transporter ATP-binding protein [Anaerolineae bacterium]|nr:ABC transporter ATP-binding protein [Anaerolineae bacterium]MCB9107773.1 ABC transporter ATP-binding protein [Anaerolineales bacterium]